MKIIKEDNRAHVYDGNRSIANAIREANNLYWMLFQLQFRQVNNLITNENASMAWKIRTQASATWNDEQESGSRNFLIQVPISFINHM